MRRHRGGIGGLVLAFLLIGSLGSCFGCFSDGDSSDKNMSEKSTESDSESTADKTPKIKSNEIPEDLIGTWTYHKKLNPNDQEVFKSDSFNTYKYKDNDEQQDTYILKKDGTYEYYRKKYVVSSIDQPPQLFYEYYQDGSYTADDEVIHFLVNESKVKVGESETDDSDLNFQDENDYILYYRLKNSELYFDLSSDSDIIDDEPYTKDLKTN